MLTEIRVGEGATVEVNTVVAVIGEAGYRSRNTAFHGTLSKSLPHRRWLPHRRCPHGECFAPRRSPAASPKNTVSTYAASPARAQVGALVRTTCCAPRSRRHYGTSVQRSAPPQVAAASSAPAQPQVQEVAAPQLASLPTEPVPLTRMRAIIAERMVESVRTSPHVYTVYRVDMTRIVRLREQHRAAFEQRHGVKLTYMPFIAAAAVAALRRFPIVNASLESGASLEKAASPESGPKDESAGLAIRYHQNINLGIAVALDWGLIVPVVRRAEQQSFVAIAAAITDLALRARSKKLLPDEVGGSTFTLTNAGAFGGEFGMPILNQPEAAILAVGGLRKEPAVLTDAEGNDSIAIRSMQYFCLGFDHRLIDGADGGKFMLEFKKTLENWNQEIA